MNPKIIILLSAVIINIFFGFLVLLKNKKQLTNRAYFALVFSIAIWGIDRVLMEIMNIHHPFLYEISIFLYISASIIMNALFAFALAFIYEYQKKLKNFRLKLSLLSLLNLGIILLILSGNVVKGFYLKDGVKHLIFHKIGYYIYSFYIISFFIIPIYLLFQRWRKGHGLFKIQVGLITIGAFLSGCGSVTTNLILPFFDNFNYFWLGPVFPIIMVGCMAYAVARFHLLKIRLIAAEVFIGLILWLSFLRSIFIINIINSIQIIIDILLFIFIAIFGFLLIKSIMREMSIRETMEDLAEKLKAANQRLKKLDEEKSEFLSISSHQLRTPMTIIKGYISMIMEGSFGQAPEKLKEILRKIYISNERLVKIINDLLDLSRIERGKMEYSFKPQSLEKLVSDAVLELKPLAEEKKLKLIWQKPEQELPLISLDENYIRQVILNLIDNAIKYTNQGEINVAVAKKETTVLLSIQDSGMGISKETMPYLFQRYSRGEKTYAKAAKGMGLGLYVAKKIIDDHNGRIWAESDGPGKGATFFVELLI